MSCKIFHQVLAAIKTGSPDLLIFDNVDPDDFALILECLRHPANYIAQFSFQIHWFASDKILKVVMPVRFHGCAEGWLHTMIMIARCDGLIPGVWHETMWFGYSREYNNFIGEHTGSVKALHWAFIPLVGPDRAKEAEFPSVVLESGWSESAIQLRRDARLWQEGSRQEVRVVLQVEFYRPDQQNQIRVDLSISRTCPGGHPTQVEHYAIFPAPEDPQQNPSISLDEFYAGDCPPTIDPAIRVPLDLARLRDVAAGELRHRGNMPAE
ncbi:hypothetical protein L873DRAFT_1816216 [Choiromyces venosus 120613-1]|uniref:Uncharacterized protein n=1 Tax=Choiromyces venosus 120613-1 TaxID=1336337 RepID=A0A3N4J7J3_9PEZI|nr:hypothetical protein L873DRAFT_1816216 [Choiromyces venosus 120613-1]